MHGDGSDRIEEELHVEDERQHRSDFEGVAHDHGATDNDDDRHCSARKRINQRDHYQSDAGGAFGCPKLFVGLFFEEVEVDVFTAHALHYSDTVDVFG